MKTVNERNYSLAKKSALKCFSRYFGDSADAMKYLCDHERRVLYTLGKLEKILEGCKGKKVLEIGFSPVTPVLHFFLDEEDLAVLDRSLALGRRLRADGIGFLKADLNRPFEIRQKYDVVLFNEVFEHLYCDEIELIGRIVKGMAGNGFLILSTPNLNSLKNIRLVLAGRGINPLHAEVIASGGRGHVREYSAWEMSHILSKTGCRIELFEYADYLDGYCGLISSPRVKNAGALGKLILAPQIAAYVALTKFFPRLRSSLFFIVRKNGHALRNSQSLPEAGPVSFGLLQPNRAK